MLPVIHNAVPGNGVQAIFLYPLNALAEDQKTRFSKYIEVSGRNLHFATYNGIRPKMTRDDNYVVPLKHEINTRQAIRETPPEILVTNPTMLEYMLLRDKDRSVLIAAKRNLRWIVIDETHTFKGLRRQSWRCCSAGFCLPPGYRRIRCSLSPRRLRQVRETMPILRNSLRVFRGNRADQIEIISGKRVCPSNWCVRIGSPSYLSEARQREIRDILLRPESEYVPLNGLIPEGKTIAEKLGLLDDLCEYCHLPVKVHYFFRTLSEGLSVRLNKIHDGRFELFAQQQDDDADFPLLELVRCPYCGTLLAKASGTIQKQHYEPARKEDHLDIFEMTDDDSDTDDDGDDKNDAVADDDNSTSTNTLYFCPGQEYEVTAGHAFSYNPQRGTLNVRGGDVCPLSRLVSEKGARRGNDQTAPRKPIELKSFRISSQYLSRILAPVFLDQTESQSEPGLPHAGQQFISFIDSRQAAALSRSNNRFTSNVSGF